MDRGAWWATVHGATKSRTWLSVFDSHKNIHEKDWLYSLALFWWFTLYSSEARRLNFGGWSGGMVMECDSGGVFLKPVCSFHTISENLHQSGHSLSVMSWQVTVTSCDLEKVLCSLGVSSWDRAQLSSGAGQTLTLPLDQVPLCSEQSGQLSSGSPGQFSDSVFTHLLHPANFRLLADKSCSHHSRSCFLF